MANAAKIAMGAALLGLGLAAGSFAVHQKGGRIHLAEQSADRAPPEHPSVLDPRVSQMVSTLERLDARLEMLEAHRVPEAPAQLEAARPAAEPSPFAEHDPAAALERERETLDDLEAAVKAEPRDARWDREFRGNLDKALSSADPAQVRLLDVRCGSTMCRAELGIEGDMSHHVDALLEGLATAAPHGDIWLNDQLLGPQRAVMFSARYGSRLPL